MCFSINGGFLVVFFLIFFIFYFFYFYGFITLCQLVVFFNSEIFINGKSACTWVGFYFN